MGIVSFQYCANYDLNAVERSLRSAFAAIGLDIGREVFGKKVLIKPNLLGAHLPEKAVTTHPAIIEVLIRILKDYDCELWLGDSPNGVQKSLEDVWAKTGMSELCNRYGVTKKYFEKVGAATVSEFLISKAVLDADYIINVPKLKTHGLTVLTVAVKNMFGIVPGLKKAYYHKQALSAEMFAKTLVRIAEVRRPNLNIVDGVEAMAGNGPSGGYKVDFGLIAAGRNMHEVDFALAKLLNVEPTHIDTLKAAADLGFFHPDIPPEIRGREDGRFNTANFRLPITYTRNLKRSRIFHSIVSYFIGSVHVKPYVRKKKCVRCGMCLKICPVSAIKFQKDGYPEVSQKDCIECYCCHETCPEKAVGLSENLSLKISKWFSAR